MYERSPDLRKTEGKTDLLVKEVLTRLVENEFSREMYMEFRTS
jgi:hypothetical protein